MTIILFSSSTSYDEQLAYNRDLQEDKEPLFDAVDQVRLALGALCGMVSTATFVLDRMAEAADSPTSAATESLDLDGFFGLHLGLSGLHPLWQSGELAFVHATSTPYRDKRSHFDGQDLLEAGTSPDLPSAHLRDGWLNRMLQAMPGLQQARWQKLVWNVPYNGLSVLLKASTAPLMADASSRALILALMDEVVQGARACGHHLPDGYAEQLFNMTEKMPDYWPSMYHDHVHKRALELAAIYGAPLAAARAAGCELPRIEALFQALSFIDRHNA